MRSSPRGFPIIFPAGPIWPSGGRRSLWLEQALAAEARDSEPDHAGGLPSRADVCIVGGGFTGLWTALGLIRREPGLDIVVIDADICGGGASGRNGGFVMTSWSKFSSLRKLCGDADALRYAQACEAAVAAIGAFCAEQDIDGDFSPTGWLWTATNRSQLGAWETAVEEIARAGATPYEILTPDEAASRAGSETHLAGVFEAAAATFHPAKVARGLAMVARRNGITVIEQTPVREIHSGHVPSVVTDYGVIAADKVLLAVNAWTAALPEAQRALVVTSSDIVATEPIGERLDASGWRRGLSISDSRRLVNYYQRTQDDRVVFGKGGGTLGYRGRIGTGFHGESARGPEVRGQFHRAYPQLADIPVPHSWRGPIDYSVSGVPFIFCVGGHPGVLAAAGFSGNGCGPAYVAGEAMAAQALEQSYEAFPEALRRVPESPLPREPVRYLGGRLVRAAIARKERREDAERTPDPLTTFLAGLDPTGFVDRELGSGTAGAEAALSEPATGTP